MTKRKAQPAATTPAILPPEHFKREDRLTAWFITIAMIALFIGGALGPLQKLEHVGINLYPALAKIGIGSVRIQSYYQGLTAHGVLNALVWTTFFIVGFFTYAIPRSLGRPLKQPRINLLALILMIVGLVMAAIPILTNMASVLYTFYPPMKASVFFYLGLVLVVVGSWVAGLGYYVTYWQWRKDNPGQKTPFIALAAIITMVMWQIATLGIATEILVLIIPWVLGWTDGTDPQLARTFFWFTGHPLVYFWLLPAYVSWYAMLPKQAGGKLFSDSLARLSFWLFFVLSTPLGFHHQYTDPGVPPLWKYIHSLLTFAVAFPSLLTAFTVVASLEFAGRQRGGKGLTGWIRKLPWGDPSVTAQVLSGVLFIFGGIGGIVNASYNINLVVHNTAWVPGHFHLTVASAATMSFMGICYWLVPHVTGRKLWAPKLALVQAWTWFVGMAIFSTSMHRVGLLGAPRRTPLGVAPYVPASWQPWLIGTAIGGVIMFVGAYLFITVLVVTVLRKKAPAAEVPQVPEAEALQDPQQTPAWLDRWAPWLAAAIVLVLIAYGPNLFYQITNMANTSPGFKVW